MNRCPRTIAPNCKIPISECTWPRCMESNNAAGQAISTGVTGGECAELSTIVRDVNLTSGNCPEQPVPAAPSEKPQRDVLVLLAELRQIYGVPQSLIDELAEMDRQFHAAQSATQQSDTAKPERLELPHELFDGYAVWKALGDDSGVSPRNVAAVLDAVVRLIRSNQA